MTRNHDARNKIRTGGFLPASLLSILADLAPTASRAGQIITGDNNYVDRDFEATLAGGRMCLRTRPAPEERLSGATPGFDASGLGAATGRWAGNWPGVAGSLGRAPP